MLQDLSASVILWVVFLWQVPLCLWLQEKFGFMAMLAVNLGLSFTAGIILSLTSCFWAVPYAIPARLMCSVMGILPNGLPARAGSMTFQPELLSAKVVLPGILISIIWFAVFWFATRKWYERQGK